MWVWVFGMLCVCVCGGCFGRVEEVPASTPRSSKKFTPPRTSRPPHLAVALGAELLVGVGRHDLGLEGLVVVDLACVWGGIDGVDGLIMRVRRTCDERWVGILWSGLCVVAPAYVHPLVFQKPCAARTQQLRCHRSPQLLRARAHPIPHHPSPAQTPPPPPPHPAAHR